MRKKRLNTVTDLRKIVSIGLFLFVFMAFCHLMNPLQVYATTYEYDELGRVTKVTYEDGTSVTYAYDANGNLTEVITYTTEEGEMTDPDDKPSGGGASSGGGGIGNTDPSGGSGGTGNTNPSPGNSSSNNGVSGGTEGNAGGIGSILGQGIGSLTNGNADPNAPYVGMIIHMGDAEYRITSINGGVCTVQFVRLTKEGLTLYQVPDYIEYRGKRYLVTSIGAYAFAENTMLREVILGRNVKSIGNYAFYNCTKLKHIKIWSDKLISVGKDAYQGIHRRADICIGKVSYKRYRLGTKERGMR